MPTETLEESLVAPPISKAHHLVSLLSSLPPDLAAQARSHAEQHFATLAASHGQDRALSILSAGLKSVAVPKDIKLAAPLLGAAELYVRLSATKNLEPVTLWLASDDADAAALAGHFADKPLGRIYCGLGRKAQALASVVARERAAVVPTGALVPDRVLSFLQAAIEEAGESSTLIIAPPEVLGVASAWLQAGQPEIGTALPRAGRVSKGAVLRVEGRGQEWQVKAQAVLKCMEGENAHKPGPCPGPARADAGESQQGHHEESAGHVAAAERDWKENGVRSKAFKSWFGDWESDPESASKVVSEETGEPLVVYHGTHGDFDTFKKDTKNAWSDSLGFDTYFFSEGQAVASTYANQFKDGKVMPVYLDIKKPLLIDVNGGEWPDAIAEAVDNIRTYRTPEEKHYLEVMDEYQTKYGYELEYEPDSIPPEETAKVEKAATDLQNHILDNKKLYRESPRHPYGYDGIIVKNVLDMTAAGVSEDIESYSPYTTVYITFKQGQIKSANNRGTFDPANANINKSLPRHHLDRQGGELPIVDRTNLERADFITYPEDVQGSNCSNCIHNPEGVCQFHGEVAGQEVDLRGQPVNGRNCCSGWDARGTLRMWRQRAKTARPVRKSQPADASGDADTDPLATAELIADVLGGLLGEDALLAFEESQAEEEGKSQGKAFAGVLKAWDALQHPRGANGRFIPKGSPEAVASAKAGIDEIRKLGEGARTPEHAKKLADHLSILTVKQLHELKKEYGLKASGKLREQLVAKLLDRLPGAQERINKERQAAAKQLGLPAEATMRDVVEHLAVEAGYPEHFLTRGELDEKLDALGVSVPVQRGEAVRAAFEVLREGVREKKPEPAPEPEKKPEPAPENPKPEQKPSAGKPKIEPAGKVSIEWDGTVVPDENGKYNGYRVGDQLFASRAAAQRHIAEQQQQAQQAAETQAEDTRQEEDRKRAREEAVREHEARQERIATVSAVATDRVKEELRAAGLGDIARRTKPRLGGIDLPKNAPEEAQQIRDRVIAELSDLATRSIREKLTPDQIRAEAEKLRTPKPPEPGFTGTDSLGRRWENGKLVAKPEEEKPGTVDFGTPETPDEPPVRGNRGHYVSPGEPDYEYRAPKASEQRLREVGANLEKIFADATDEYDRVDIVKLRQLAQGVPRREFDDALRLLRREGKIRMIAIGDLSDHTTEELNESVPGVSEVFRYLEPKEQPASAAPSSPKPPEPGFTGTDALGRRWENGKLVAKPQEEKPAVNSGKSPQSPIDNTPRTSDNTSGGGEKPKPEEPKMSSPKIDESGIKEGAGNGNPEVSRTTFQDIIKAGNPGNEAMAKRQAKTAVVNALWGGLQPSYAADQLIHAGYDPAIVQSVMASRLDWLSGATDDFTPEKIASLQKDVQAWLDAKGGAA